MAKRAFKSLVFFSCAVSLMTSTASAQTQTHDRRVYYTFSGKVEIPNSTLPAGRYLFHLVDESSGRKMVEVRNADNKSLGMFRTTIVQRTDIPKTSEVRFMEAPAGAPPAIRTIWYEGERGGRELIYPREQALRIARATSQPVLTTKGPSTRIEDVKEEEMVRVSPSGQDVPVDSAQPAAVTGRLEQGTTAADAPAPAATSGREPARENLPKTASSMPLALVAGIAFLALGMIGIRASRAS
jgi:LPXTG-motif cell wall-anchored protein